MGKPVEKPLRLYIDASPLAEDNITGIPHFTAELVRTLDKHPQNGQSFKIILVIAFDKKNKLAKWDYGNVQIKTITLPMRLLNLVWKYNILPPMDLLLGKGVYLFPNYKNWRLSRSQSLTYIHDLGFIRYPQFTQPKNLEFLRANIKRWTSRADVILTGSDHAREEIIELLKVAPSRVVRIYHGVDHSQYYPRKESDIATAKTKYRIRGEYLLYIGSLEPRKNLTRLINSYRKLPQNLRKRYSLCFIGGGGWLNDEILEAINLAKREGFNIVQPNLYVEDKDLPSLISGATLLVHPALYEGFGLSPLQAMACGTPVLVGDNSSLPEIVGTAGVLVDAESESDISAKIEEVLADEKYRSTLIKSGLKQAQKFRWEISAQDLLECAQEVSAK
jgi:glycosyltransferase involved in cell wall biosynthesis